MYNLSKSLKTVSVFFANVAIAIWSVHFYCLLTCTCFNIYFMSFLNRLGQIQQMKNYGLHYTGFLYAPLKTKKKEKRKELHLCT